MNIIPIGTDSGIQDHPRTGALLSMQDGGKAAETSVKSSAGKGGVNLTLHAEDNSFLNAYADKKRSVAEEAANGQASDVKTDRDMMVVMRSTMSEEDFNKAMADGFDLMDMVPEEAVTILDRIKVDVALGGTEVAGFTDTVDPEVLKEITGSETAAKQMEEAFARADLPLTKENAIEVQDALSLAGQVDSIGEDAIRYMTENRMDATIKNLYLASHSTNGVNTAGAGFYAQDAEGYYAQRADTKDLETITPQVEAVLEEAGFDASDEKVKALAFSMIEEGVPLTADTLQRSASLHELTLPLEEKTVIDAAALALAKGIDATDADVTPAAASGMPLSDMDVESLNALKRLTETRYLMICEANRSVMTAELEATTVELRDSIAKINDAIATLQAVQPEDAAATSAQIPVPEELEQDRITAFFLEKQALYTETIARIDTLETAPAEIISRMGDALFTDSFESVTDKAAALKQRYLAAGETYEALMTAPRADLGDSIKKAFRNVDDILADMNEEPGEENRRAVRILGYNRMEITKEQLEAVKAADAKLTALMERLRPAAVLNMIRDGKNPLNMTLDEMDEYLRTQETSDEVSDEKYAKFLYKLDHNNAITAEERESFIGIYRLFHTLKRTDDAAIGMLLNTGTEMTVRNLLTATRTNAKTAGGIDVRADASFAGIDGSLKGTDIARQIETAFIYYKAKADLVYETIAPEKLHAYGNPEEAELTELAEAMATLPPDEALEAAYRKDVLNGLRDALPKKDGKTNKGALEKRAESDDTLTESRRIATLRQHLLFLREE